MNILYNNFILWKKKIFNILKFLKEVELLKSITRHSWTSSWRQESVAEHSWRMAIMVIVLEDEFPDLNIKRVLELTLIHDFWEAYEWDSPAFKEQPKNKLEVEKNAIIKITASLSKNMQDKIMWLWKEYNECKTKEAQLAKALDKLEVLIQHNEADISTWEKEEYEYNLIHGMEYMKFNEFIEKFREIVDNQTKEKVNSFLNN